LLPALAQSWPDYFWKSLNSLHLPRRISKASLEHEADATVRSIAVEFRQVDHVPLVRIMSKLRCEDRIGH
jgi:hypothetical protein